MAVRRKVRSPSEKPRSPALAGLDRAFTTKLTIALVAMTAVVTTARVALAEMTLRWDAPPSCPQRDEVLERIRKLAGSSLDKTEGLSVEGNIERAGGRYSLTLLVRDDHDVRKRVIASESCADLAGAAAVTLALLLGIDVSAALAGGASLGGSAKDGATTTDGQDGGSSPTSTDEAKTPANEQRDARSDQDAPPPVKPPPPAPDVSSPTERWGFLLRAPTAHADFGPLPRPALGVGAGVGVRYDAWRFLLAGHVSQGQRADAPEPNGASGAELDRVTAELSACRGFRFSSVELAPCAAVALEVVTARGFGESVAPQSARAAWPALGVGGIAYWYPWKSLALFGSATGYVELSRPRLVIEGVGEIAELSPAAAAAAVGAEWIF